jgi:hypothetical protein
VGGHVLGDGHGLLVRLALSRGAAVPDASGWTIKCPNACNHTTADRTARLYPPKPNAPFGWILCQHSHCSGFKSPVDWLACFSAAELAAAGIRAASVSRTYVNRGRDGATIRIGVELRAHDGADLPYLRITAGTAAWDALWRAAEVDPPHDLDEAGDLGGALDDLRGRRLLVELAASDLVRRVLPAVGGAA